MFDLVEYKIFLIILLVFCKYFLLWVGLNLLWLFIVFGEVGLLFFVEDIDIIDWLIFDDSEVLLFFLNLIVKAINYFRIDFLVLFIRLFNLVLYVLDLLRGIWVIVVNEILLKIDIKKVFIIYILKRFKIRVLFF